MICINCGCPELEENDSHCWNCGHELNSNYCSNEHCVLNSENDESQAPCRENACYCSECGSKTVYFINGLISPIVFEKKNQ